MKTYTVFGWPNASDYDAGKPASHVVFVKAKDEADADDKGDRKLAREHGKCDVILSEEATHNLDGFASAADLRAHGESLKGVAPPAYCDYAIAKARAMEMRAVGDISAALQHEGDCEALYAVIRGEWRW